jgi:hypothetical protein
MSLHTSPKTHCYSSLSISAVSDSNAQTNDSIHTECFWTSQKCQWSPIMLSDASDSPSSDIKSFDEEDMFGQDLGIDPISLMVSLGCLASLDEDINGYDVCICIFNHSIISHL